MLHRWAGLTIAAFLFVSGITGAVISWDHELDDLLNPHLVEVSSRGKAISSLELARQIEARHLEVRVTQIPLEAKAGESLGFGVAPRVNPATGKLFEPGFNQVFVDPVTGAEIGKREWGAAWPITRETVVSFLYVLHYSLHIPEMWSIDHWGMWLMGAIALIWIADCFVGFYLTLPVRRARRASRAASVERELTKGFWLRWKPAWKIKTGGSSYRINFDIHRAFGLWFWLLLFILAVSAASLNLNDELAKPIVRAVSSFTPTPFDLRQEQPKEKPIEPAVTFARILDIARAEAERREWREPAGSISYQTAYGFYSVSFFFVGDDHGAAGVGPRALYFDGGDGRYLGNYIPWKGTAGDLFLQVQFPLHSGRILGIPGRIVISFMGLAVAALSVTGVVIWYRKRRGRVRQRAAQIKAGERKNRKSSPFAWP